MCLRRTARAAARAVLKRAAGSFAGDEARHRDYQELAQAVYLDDGERLFHPAAVGQVYDAPFEQVVTVQLVQHDERVGGMNVCDFEPDMLI